ncbi:hypothetical protein [Embleya sp. MST-111070]|uniref:hypothetical protein n=1 Tax=Embleya sp. MST-111070 TaxID=3398231 RepID=UPI003F73B389
MVVTAAALAVDAWVHADLAAVFDRKTEDIFQGTLFRIDAATASLAALLVVTIRHWSMRVFAVLVAAAGLGAILLYRYVDVGALGPLPNMYEPIWYPKKTSAAWAAGAATAGALALTTTSLAGPPAPRPTRTSVVTRRTCANTPCPRALPLTAPHGRRYRSSACRRASHSDRRRLAKPSPHTDPARAAELADLIRDTAEQLSDAATRVAGIAPDEHHCGDIRELVAPVNELTRASVAHDRAWGDSWPDIAARLYLHPEAVRRRHRTPTPVKTP